MCAAAARASRTVDFVRICNSSDYRQSISHACGSSKAVNDLVEELLGSGVLALSQPPMRFMMLYFGTGQGQVDGGSIDKYQESTGEKSERPMSLPSADRCCSCPVVEDIRLHVGAAEGNI
jgi:hypothetical protein